MGRTITLFETLTCQLKRTNSRRVRLTVAQGGVVTLTVPKRLSLVTAQEYIVKKKDWILATYARAIAHPPRLLTQGGDKEYRAMKETARKQIAERVAFFTDRYGVTCRSLSIRNQSSRFGSCSARGHLSFNYRLIFLPSHLFDYVIVHEVCHLRELNHSPRFWALVAETVPEYCTLRRELQVFSRTV